MTADLHLHYKFTDRGGNYVYEKYLAEDRITMHHPLGELRLTPHGTTNIRLTPYTKTNITPEPLVETKRGVDAGVFEVCWKNQPGIVCKCPDCVDDRPEDTGHGTG